jgi:hypothetical protein
MLLVALDIASVYQGDPRFKIYHYGHMVAGGPIFSPDIRKLLQQADRLHWVPLFLAVELPFTFVGIVTAMMRAFGSLIARLVGLPWVKVIWAPSFVSKSLPSRGIGHSGRYRDS